MDSSWWDGTEETSKGNEKKLGTIVIYFYIFSLTNIFLPLRICKSSSFYREYNTVFPKILALICPMIGYWLHICVWLDFSFFDIVLKMERTFWPVWWINICILIITRNYIEITIRIINYIQETIWKVLYTHIKGKQKR